MTQNCVQTFRPDPTRSERSDRESKQGCHIRQTMSTQVVATFKVGHSNGVSRMLLKARTTTLITVNPPLSTPQEHQGSPHKLHDYAKVNY